MKYLTTWCGNFIVFCKCVSYENLIKVILSTAVAKRSVISIANRRNSVEVPGFLRMYCLKGISAIFRAKKTFIWNSWYAVNDRKLAEKVFWWSITGFDKYDRHAKNVAEPGAQSSRTMYQLTAEERLAGRRIRTMKRVHSFEKFKCCFLFVKSRTKLANLRLSVSATICGHKVDRHWPTATAVLADRLRKSARSSNRGK